MEGTQAAVSAASAAGHGEAQDVELARFRERVDTLCARVGVEPEDESEARHERSTVRMRRNKATRHKFLNSLDASAVVWFPRTHWDGDYSMEAVPFFDNPDDAAYVAAELEEVGLLGEQEEVLVLERLGDEVRRGTYTVGFRGVMSEERLNTLSMIVELVARIMLQGGANSKEFVKWYVDGWQSEVARFGYRVEDLEPVEWPEATEGATDE